MPKEASIKILSQTSSNVTYKVICPHCGKEQPSTYTDSKGSTSNRWCQFCHKDYSVKFNN